MTSYLEISHVTKSFPSPRDRTVVVQDFHLNVAPGEFVTLIGHSGCGKSTVLSMVAGLAEPDEGGIILEGREVVGPGPDRGVVFQAPCLLPWLSTLDNVLLGVNQTHRRAARRERRAVAARHLELVGLADSLHRRPGELSQGMRQRVGLARAFALAPKLLLLDEPFGMLDSLTRYELQDVLVELCRRDRKTALMVTHDIDEALFLSDRGIMMTDGRAGTVGEVMAVPFSRPRDRRALLEEPAYYALREDLIGFLEQRSALRPAAVENRDLVQAYAAQVSDGS